MVSCGTLTVEQPQAEISLQDCQTSPPTGVIDQNTTVEVSATLQNQGDADGSVTVTFRANGQQVATRQVSVPADGTQGVPSATFTPSSLGITGQLSTEVEVSGADAAARRAFADGGVAQGLSRQDSGGGCHTCGE